MKAVKRSKILGKTDFLLTFLPVFTIQTILCLAGMLGAAIQQAPSKFPHELKKISIRKD